MVIRRATEADAAALSELYLRHLTQTPPEEAQESENGRRDIDFLKRTQITP